MYDPKISRKKLGKALFRIRLRAVRPRKNELGGWALQARPMVRNITTFKKCLSFP